MNVSAIFPNQSSAVGNRQDPPPIPSAPGSSRMDKAEINVGVGMDTLTHVRTATLAVAWGLSFSPPQASPLS